MPAETRHANVRAKAAKHAIRFDQVALVLGGHRIIDGMSFELKAGEFVCVVGPSGCGKTTLLRLLSGLFRPSAGSISYGDRLIEGPSPEIAIVFQDYGKALLPWRTAAGNISLALESRGIPPAQRQGRIAQLLQKVGLASHSDKYPNQMSGGMQQRLQIARCLAQEPAVLLMDEPFGALDAMTRQSLQDEVARLAEEAGTTVLFITHDIEEAIYLGDRVIALKANPGRVAEIIEVNIPRARDQLSTREHPEFLRLRRYLYDFVQETHC
ncbi:ABC transporter ATP-binding protein [Glaciimonas sp. CA11.2]|nr:MULTISPECIES: ABC transporter ATP-binding protein [unclassified Glaciimonas]MDY7547615.1 ABC transporter ATP-binding protein [Glaciimonas sp. CA11.2]MEB0014383.1 ABC transporter ATP-binding protein [Glaciimonas sp. Cout2]MEB0084341.1 ABC transporter ATP-binding protein [Glaciimonas sp. Gout2]MEB0164036.1 ABC transporter ATP-binding protein [Glaciimonas sp. CA11.2]